MRMKIFESPQKDLEKNLSFTLEVIQKQLRDLRDDNQQIVKQINICVKALAILVASPVPEDSEEIEGLEAR